MSEAGVVARVRAFNRFYTRVIGALEAGLLGTPYSLTEARVLFELAERAETSVSDLRHLLGIDAGYLSRILRRFAADGLVVRETAPDDGRRQVVRLTEQGRAAFARLDHAQARAIERLLDPLDEHGRHKLVGAMEWIRAALDGTPLPRTIVLRGPAPGELGWIISRHRDREAEAARTVADFASRADPREAAWIAEVDGEPAGCALCLADGNAARLALLSVEPSVRRTGIGSRLVAECVRSARTAGFDRITARVPDGSAAARVLARAGFEADRDGWTFRW
ncbi:MAG TPA: helix-turn-helix domain-containing GNAT family N-acetyltransferase [Pseudonocardia sp.]|jgi:DNA-binding MarR family transcriptional regulator|uniref:bifunctional helix-turn-helix transcriptional regulator/GNAT family N-acetyltransferase n=1 Tax=Pseudonocardia sp. TaxID=60912 RepID=UPI002B4AD3A9|nr:helix-turn-helix domain-containing GNAT family N-acetyltransferase [Pseudonocardia sp.]HLU55483.1 helix-turn-helix domain-containing GNAT family N-acetyltransferase [Pseudonocardia sp.]